MNARAHASCLLISVLLAPGCVIEVDDDQAFLTEERRFTASSGVELEVRSFDGSIDVQAWDADEVAVRIERTAPTRRRAEALEVRSSQEGNRIVIEAVPPGDDDDGFGDDGAVSFIVRAPRQITLRAETTDGAIHASGFEGTIRINTGDGSVRTERLRGEVNVRTADGAILMQEVDGGVDAESGDGGIEVSGRLESVRVHSGDGRVDVDAIDGSTVRSNWSLTTGDGRIALRIPETIDADLQADSGDGRVRADWPNELSSDRDDDGESYRARLGNGGSLIRLQSGDGAIEVRRR